MAGRHVSTARPTARTLTRNALNSATRWGSSGRHAGPLAPRTFGGTSLTVEGVTRDAMGAASLLGSSIPKGPLAPALAAAHGSSVYTLAASEVDAQRNIASVLAGIDAVSTSRALRAVSRNAEGVAPSSTPISVQGARLLANGRGPRVAVMGMVAGDVARAVATFDRYGYTVNRAMVPTRLDPMTKYSFWQLADPAILGAMPQVDRETVAAAFERGVTVWTDVGEIGTHPTNAPRAGISY